VEDLGRRAQFKRPNCSQYARARPSSSSAAVPPPPPPPRAPRASKEPSGDGKRELRFGDRILPGWRRLAFKSVAMSALLAGAVVYFDTSRNALMRLLGLYKEHPTDHAVAPPVASSQMAETPFEEMVDMTNWSATHSATAARVYEPRSEEELAQLLAAAHARGERVRAVGTALSPNGIGLCDEDQNLVSLAAMDGVLEVDATRMQVTVQAGA